MSGIFLFFSFAFLGGEVALQRTLKKGERSEGTWVRSRDLAGGQKRGGGGGRKIARK